MLKTRLITSILLIPSFLAALFYLNATAWSLLMMAICLIGLHEWSAMLHFSTIQRSAYLLLSNSIFVAALFGHYLGVPSWMDYLVFWSLLLSCLFWIVFVPLWLLSRRPIHHKGIMAWVGWLMILPTYSAMIELRNISPMLLLLVMLAVWIADSAAYFSGKAYGKHKLAPEISPGKTWEGVAGASIAMTLYGVLLHIYAGLQWWGILGLWCVLVLSIMGDLFESLIKRQSGVKDSGQLLPGHGGILDRIDGLTATLPIITFSIYFPLYYASWNA